MNDLQKWLKSYDKRHSIEYIETVQKLCMCEKRNLKIPDSIDKLKNLQILELIANQIKELPATIGYLKNLDKLYLQNNPIKNLRETMPDEWSILFLYNILNSKNAIDSYQPISELL